MPIGGPAARILSELVLNQIDRLLRTAGIAFCRFADDFHIFCKSNEDASATNLLRPDTESARSTDHETLDAQERAKGLMQLSLRFDPYSPTRLTDYAALKAEIERFDVLGLLREELLKSRVHISLARKLVAAIKYLDAPAKDTAISTLMDNAELLYPIFSGVLTVAKSVFSELSPKAQIKIHQAVVDLIEGDSHVLRVDLNLAFALRLLSCRHSPEAEAAIAKIYKHSNSSALLRRDIILIMAKWKNWYWLSDLRANFRSMSPSEKRAFIVGSYALRDEGKHWRQHTSGEFSPFEQLVQIWASEKNNQPGWSIPL